MSKTGEFHQMNDKNYQSNMEINVENLESSPVLQLDSLMTNQEITP